MESIASTSMDGATLADRKESHSAQGIKEKTGGIFTCSYCSLQERFDFKGAKPPFARQITYSENCYIMKDPFSLPGKGEVLVLGADCSICDKPVCLGCSIYFGKRFCSKCATSHMQHLPHQLHAKIRSILKQPDT